VGACYKDESARAFGPGPSDCNGDGAAGDEFWHQDTSGIGDAAEPFDRFGSSLAAANFGKSAAADLDVGVQSEDVGAVAGAGAVAVLYGSASGLSAAGDQFWHQSVAGVVGEGVEEFDLFGQVLSPKR
jgi:hypothetical protein